METAGEDDINRVNLCSNWADELDLQPPKDNLR